MTRAILASFLALLVLLALACDGGAEEEPSPQPSPTSAPTPTPTPTEGAAASPAPAPAKIFFLSEREPRGAYLMDADGSNVVWIGGTSFASGVDIWSTDGSKAAAVRCPEDPADRNSELLVVNADGSGEVNVSNHPDPDVVLCQTDAPSGGFDWSPDGNRLLFHSLRDPRGLYMVNADGSGLAFFLDAVLPSWSPDGELIAFIGGTDETSWEMDLEVINPDGSDRTLLADIPCNWSALSDACQPSQVRWSPDGALLVFTAYPSQPIDFPPELSSEIYIIGADGTGLTRITDSPEEDYRPSWVDCSRPTAGCQAQITNIAPDTLNLREAPSVDAPAVGEFDEGDLVCLIGPSSFGGGFRWWPIRSEDGIEGQAAQADPDELGSPWITPTGDVCE